MAESFLGSKISLISKKGIRYEGILRAVDSAQSTITLSEVVSFGTENRPCESHIPACNNVYEYIIFRGSDIRDLHVCAPFMPPTQQNTYWNNDPAIVSVSQSPVSQLPQPPPTHEMPCNYFESPVIGMEYPRSVAQAPIPQPSIVSQPAPPPQQQPQPLLPPLTQGQLSLATSSAPAPQPLLAQPNEMMNLPPAQASAPSTSVPTATPLLATTLAIPQGKVLKDSQQPEPSAPTSKPTPLFSPDELTQAVQLDLLKSLGNVPGLGRAAEKIGNNISSGTGGGRSNAGVNSGTGASGPGTGTTAGGQNARVVGSYAFVAAGGFVSRRGGHGGGDASGGAVSSLMTASFPPPHQHQSSHNSRGPIASKRGANASGPQPLEVGNAQHSSAARNRAPPGSQHSTGGHSRGPRGGAAQKPLDFKNDYDFEAANAKIAEELTKMKISAHAAEEENQPAETEASDLSVVHACGDNDENHEEDPSKFYNKKKSFFDTISSEAISRVGSNTAGQHHGSQHQHGSGRFTRNEERRLNVETFGAEVDVGGYRSGGRGGGYHRGGGGYSQRAGGCGGVRRYAQAYHH